jgi:uncharacterized protein
MLFAVLFEDRPDSVELRKSLLAAHLAWIEAHRQFVIAAGSLRDAADVAQGGLWIVRAHNVGLVEAILHTDPFWSGGLRAGVKILRWSLAGQRDEAVFKAQDGA